MKKSAKTLLCAAAAIMLSACIVDQRIIGPDDPDGTGGPGGRDGNVTVTLNLNPPGGFAAPAATRALSYDGEVALSDVRVLVFDAAGSKLLTIESPDVVTQPSGNNGRQGEIALELPAFTGSRQLVVIANVDDLNDHDMVDGDDNEYDNGVGKIVSDLFEAQQEGGDDVSKEDIVDALRNMKVVEFLWLDKNDSTNTLPMWGETTVTVDEDETEVEAGEVDLMRAVARIDVGVGAPSGNASGGTNHGAWTWNGKDAENEKIPFELKSVHVIRSTDVWAAIPAPANFDNGKLKTPTVPTPPTAVTVDKAIEDALVYSGSYLVTDEGGEATQVPVVTPSKDGNGSYITRTVYIPEAEVDYYAGGVGSTPYVQRPALVVGGQYDANGDGDYEDTGEDVINYYRIDFKNTDPATQKEKLFDVLRNHLYQFNIAGVTGKGKPTVKEAYESEAMNMKVNVLDWNQGDHSDIEWLGQKFFSFSERPVIFGPLVPLDAPREIILRTNIDEGFTMSLGEFRDEEELMIVAPTTEGPERGYPMLGENDKFGYELTLTDKPDSPGGVYTYSLLIYASTYWGYEEGRAEDEALKQQGLPKPDLIDLWTVVVGNNRLTTEFMVKQTWAEHDPTPYTITMADVAGGSTLANREQAPAGTVITLVANPDSGNSFDGWTFTAPDGPDDGSEPDVFTPVFDPATATAADNPLRFTMPAHDVTVTPAWIEPVRPVTGVAPYIIYIENPGTDNATLRLGKWADRVNEKNIAYFKFGSVVGTYNPRGDITGPNDRYDTASDLGFNPIPEEINPIEGDDDQGWATIPYFNSTHGDGVGSASTPRLDVTVESGYITDNNLRWGKGDPCHLIGLSASKARSLARAGTLDDYKSGWRLPTALESYVFVGYLPVPDVLPKETLEEIYLDHPVDITHPEYGHVIRPYYYKNFPASANSMKINGGYLPVLEGPGNGINFDGTFMPAPGFRWDSDMANLGLEGHYWTSTSYKGENYPPLHGLSMSIRGLYLEPARHSYAYWGFTVRCVPDGPLTPGPGDFTGDPDDWTDKELENKL